jgi:hypothetical protein
VPNDGCRDGFCRASERETGGELDHAMLFQKILNNPRRKKKVYIRPQFLAEKRIGLVVLMVSDISYLYTVNPLDS